MDRDPGDFPRFTPDKPVAEMTDDEFDSYMACFPPCPGILHIDDEDPKGDAAVEADIAAGRVYDHAIFGQWLLTWGKPGRKPFKEWLADQNG